MTKFEPMRFLTADEIMSTDWPEQVFIYQLKDPRDGLIYYVGQTVDPERRLNQHCHNYLVGRRLQLWLSDLQTNNIFPLMEILDIVNKDEGWATEKRYIEKIFSEGQPILNKKGLPKEEYIIIGFMLPPDMEHDLRIRAAQMGISKSEAIRRAIKEWLNCDIQSK